MRKRQLTGDRYRIYIDEYEYRILLDNVPNRRSELAIRLAAETGLKISEVVNIRYSHIEQSELAPDVYFLYIPVMEDEDEKITRGRPRRTYLPKPLHQFLFDYVEENGLDHQEDLFQVSKRTVQSDVKKASKTASEVTGVKDFELVSPQDLRVFFAKQALEEWRIHPKVVMKIGGWSDMDTLLENLEQPTETMILREMDKAQFHGMDEWMSKVHESGTEYHQTDFDSYK